MVRHLLLRLVVVGRAVRGPREEDLLRDVVPQVHEGVGGGAGAARVHQIHERIVLAGEADALVPDLGEAHEVVLVLAIVRHHLDTRVVLQHSPIGMDEGGRVGGAGQRDGHVAAPIHHPNRSVQRHFDSKRGRGRGMEWE